MVDVTLSVDKTFTDGGTVPDMRLSRREVISLLGIPSLLSLSGCSSDSDGSPTAMDSPPSVPPTTASPTQFESTTTSPETPTQSPTGTPETSAEEVLPEPDEDWTHVETSSIELVPLIESDNIRGEYRNTEGTRFRVIIAKLPRAGIANRIAERWQCQVEWSVALQYQSFAIAASTGTTQRTFTPEPPPKMSRTPIPNTSDEARQLLERSPILTREIIEANEIQC